MPALPSVYPLSRYEDAGVVASMNGLHAQLNGGGENAVLKHKVGLPQSDLTSRLLVLTSLQITSCVYAHLHIHRVYITTSPKQPTGMLLLHFVSLAQSQNCKESDLDL